MGKGYTVQGMRELTRLTDGGKIEKYFRVEATTAGGTKYTVDLPDAKVNPKDAELALSARAEQLDKIKGA